MQASTEAAPRPSWLPWGGCKLYHPIARTTTAINHPTVSNQLSVNKFMAVVAHLKESLQAAACPSNWEMIKARLNRLRLLRSDVEVAEIRFEVCWQHRNVDFWKSPFQQTCCSTQQVIDSLHVSRKGVNRDCVSFVFKGQYHHNKYEANHEWGREWDFEPVTLDK